MPLRSYKATSPGLRQMTRSTFEEITTKEPYKPLLEPQTRGSGRNNAGRLTVRHRGGGEKQHYRIIDFKRDKLRVHARPATIQSDPTRSARIRLLPSLRRQTRYPLLPPPPHVRSPPLTPPTPSPPARSTRPPVEAGRRLSTSVTSETWSPPCSPTLRPIAAPDTP